MNSGQHILDDKAYTRHTDRSVPRNLQQTTPMKILEGPSSRVLAPRPARVREVTPDVQLAYLQLGEMRRTEDLVQVMNPEHSPISDVCRLR